MGGFTLNTDFGPFGSTILLGIAAGIVTRIFLLISDYRQYPGYPHGYLIHLSMGGVASALGAVAIPALVTQNYTAVTFLALAAQQFRDIRNMERESLGKLEETILIPRGVDYIEGIAKVFEARNYLVMINACAASAAAHIAGPAPGAAVAIAGVMLARYLAQGKVVGDVAEVVPAAINFENSLLKVDEIVIFNVGLSSVKKRLLEQGMAVRIIPRDANARATLNSPGQRQAIIHDSALILGAQKDIGEQDFTPLIRKNSASGELGLVLLPNEKDIKSLIAAIQRVPLLETSVRKPTATKAGRKARNRNSA